MDDTTVYQCPECNFNADNIEELDSHMMDHHSAETSQRSNGGGAGGGAIHHHHNHHQRHHNGHHHPASYHQQHRHHHHQSPQQQQPHHQHHARHYDEQSTDMHRHHGQHHGHSRPPLNSHHYNGYHHNHHGNNGTNSHEASYEEDDEFFNEKPDQYDNNEDEMDEYYNGQHQPNRHNHQYSSGGGGHHHHHQQHYKNGGQHHNENAHKYAKAGVAAAAAVAAALGATQSSRPPSVVVVGSTTHSSGVNSTSPLKASNSSQQLPVINSDNHYERQYACQRCNFFTNNPRAILYHRKEYHMEKINVHECLYCQYASQYSGKVERHTLLRHKIDIQNNLTNNTTPSLLNGGGATKTTTPTPQTSTTSTTRRSDIPTTLNDSESVIVDDDQNGSAINLVPNFQCHLCPCKYKRSNDLSKHLRLKHQILNASTTNGVPTPNEQDEYGDEMLDEVESDHHHHHHNHSPNNNNLKPTPPPSSSTSTASGSSSTISSSSAASLTKSAAAADAINNKKVADSGNGLLECPYCVYKTSASGPGEYLDHVREHLAGKMFRCVLCNSVYKYRGDCVVHLKRKHQSADMQAHNYVDKFELDQIEPHAVYSLLKPKQGEEYGEGVNGEQQEKLFGCAYCDYKANYKGDVYKHQTRRHPGQAKMINPLAAGANGSFTLNQSSSSLLLGGGGNSAATNGRHQSHGGDSASNYDDDDEDYLEEMNNHNEEELHHGGEDVHHHYEGEEEEGRHHHHQQPAMYGGRASDEYIDDEMDEMGEMDDEYEEEMYNQHHLGMGNGEYDEEEDDEDFFNERGGQSHEDEPLVGSQSNGASGGHHHFNGATGISNTSLNASHPHQYVNRFQCSFCSFSAASHAKLQSHLAIHYNLKPFMCPICKRRANFKWDIQKHMRKIHNDHTSEVICLSEKEARESISSYMGSVPSSSSYGIPGGAGGGGGSPVGGNRIVYDNTNRVLQSVNNQSPYKDNSSPSGGKYGATPTAAASNSMIENESMMMNQSGNGMPMLLKEKRFRCSLCTRVNSRWQYDVKKHIRNVHKGEGEIIMVEVEVDPERYQKYQRNGALLLPHSAATPPPTLLPSTTNPTHSNPSSQQQQSQFSNHSLTPNGGAATRSSTSLNGINHNGVHSPAAIPPHLAANLLANGGLISSTHLQYLNSPNNTDASGNKKFLCSLCPYRSNWKADMYRHLRKRHDMPTPNSDDMRVLSPEEAANTIEEYEHKFGQTVRKRAREPLNNSGITTSRDSLSAALPTMMMSHSNTDDMVLSSKRFKSIAMTNDSSSVQSSSANTAASQDEDDLGDEDLVDTKAGGVDRLPVSIAELNIKPYKCLKCGFRSDRKSDTLRHIRIKHDLEALQAYKFLKIMSIKDASDTIQEYEATRTSRKSVGGAGGGVGVSLPGAASVVAAAAAASISSIGSSNGGTFNTKTSLNPLNLAVAAAALAAKQHVTQQQQQQQQSQKQQQPSTQIAQQATSQSTTAPSNHPRVTINIKMPQPPSVQKENKTSGDENQTPRCNNTTEFFKCPFCIFKHMSRMVMRKHLSTHFYGNSLREAPIYQCNQCAYRSDWQYAVKRHIVTSHLTGTAAASQAQCIKLSYTTASGGGGAAQSQIDMDEKHRRLIWLKKRRRFLKRQRANNFASAQNIVLVDKTNTATTDDDDKKTKAQNENELVEKKKENGDTTLMNGNYDQDSQYEQESEDQRMEDMLDDEEEYYDEELDYDGDEDLINQNENSRTNYSHSNTSSSIGSRPPASSHHQNHQNHHHSSKQLMHHTNPTNTPSSDNTDDHYHDEPVSTASSSSVMMINGDSGNDHAKHIESINLTDHDGKDFTVSYFVANATVPSCPVTPGSSAAASPASMIKKKTYFCQTCPYKTNNYCNLKQHLLLHRFKEGCYKCRYCSYYVGMIRLIKQHEVIHPEYEPRDETFPPPRLVVNNNNNNPSSHVNNASSSFNSFVKHEQLIN